MRILVATLLTLTLFGSASGQSCQSFNVFPPAFTEAINDGTDHLFGTHDFNGSIAGNCTYTGSDATGLYGPCNTFATSTPVASEVEEFLSLTTFLVPHAVSANTNSQQGVAVAGSSPSSASATGAMAAGAKQCIILACSLSVSIGMSPVSFNFGTADVWTHGQSQTLACPARTGVQLGAATTPPQCTRYLTCTDGYAFDDTPGVCRCEPSSPIIIDTDGHGFDLTSAANGVLFDLVGNGRPRRFGWTAAGSTNAFLVFDRNWNGVIDNGTELFGTFTEQPKPPVGVERNGFLALAEFDTFANGGNGDGMIDANDNVWLSLRLWIDANHDGISQPEELHTLPSMGITGIELGYKLEERKDEFGNVFRYRGKVRRANGTVGPMAYDVLLTTK